MTFYPTDFCEILNFAAKIWVLLTKFHFLLPYVALVVRDSGGGKTTRPFPTPSTSGGGSRSLERADLVETDETAPAARGTDSADI